MPERTEPLVLINLFSMPREMVDDFVAHWESSIAPAKGAAGFRRTRLHRAIDPDAPYPVVNIARWDSVEDWRATVARHFAAPGPRAREADVLVAHPALYTVVHTTPDPQDHDDTRTDTSPR
jgi:heme-degrading monooxygenase HmoA